MMRPGGLETAHGGLERGAGGEGRLRARTEASDRARSEASGHAFLETWTGAADMACCEMSAIQTWPVAKTLNPKP